MITEIFGGKHGIWYICGGLLAVPAIPGGHCDAAAKHPAAVRMPCLYQEPKNLNHSTKPLSSLILRGCTGKNV